MTQRKIEMQVGATYQPYAECCDDECGWEWGNSSIARDAAKTHVRTTGHQVRVVVEKVSVWGPKS